MGHVAQTINGRTVHYTRNGGGDLVLLVRLAGAAGGVWDGIWPLLAAHHSVAAVDLGAPDMNLPPRAVFDGFADTILAAAAALGHERIHLVGWNGGAHIALSAAVMAPAALKSVTLMTPFRDVGERRQIEMGLEMLALLLRSGERELYAYHWFMAGFSDRFIEERFDEIDRLAKKRLANDGFLAMDVERAMRWMRALRRDHVSDGELARIGLPVLILAAGRNRWHAGPTQAMAEALHRLLGQSTLELFEEFGSFFPLEAPGATAAAILGFVERGQAPDTDY